MISYYSINVLYTIPLDHPLFRASLLGNAVTVERLCKNGADPNQRHPLGWTPLHVAAVQGHSNVVKILLQVLGTSRLAVKRLLYESCLI